MHPLDGLVTKSTSKINEPSSKANANAVVGQAGKIKIVQADYSPTPNDVLHNMSCESHCLQHNHSKKNLKMRIGLIITNDHFDYENVEVRSKHNDRKSFS